MILVDSNNIVMRASFFATKEALTGMDFTIINNMIARKRNTYGDDSIFCYVFDEPYCDYVGFHPLISRSALMPNDGYKSGRRGTEDEHVRLSLEWMSGWIQSLFDKHECVMSYPGAEADDIIAYMVDTTASSDHDTIIWSADKDLLQCVGDSTRTFAIRKGSHKEEHEMHETDVLNEKGVPPSKIRMQLALQGDSADGYKGIRGYGGRKGLEIIHDSHDINDIIQLFPSQKDILIRNWRLAGIGRDYLDDDAITRIKHMKGTMRE